MGYKMKGIKNFGEGTPLFQKKKSQADKAKKVVARNTSGDDDLKNWNVQDISAVQKDKKGKSFVTSLTDNESYSGDSDNPIYTQFTKDSSKPESWAGRDTFMVSDNYPKGLLIDETQQEEGDAQKQSTKVPSWQSEQLDYLKKEKESKNKKNKK